MSTASERLDVVPEDWKRALAVVAHPDDLEYGAAAAIARWTGQASRSPTAWPRAARPVSTPCPPNRRAACARPSNAPQRRSSVSPKSSSSVCPTGILEYGLPLRRALTAAIRRHRPEIVIGLSQREDSASGPPNQADHVAVARAAIDAVRDAGNRWVFRDLLDEGLEPWPGVHTVLTVGSPHPTHAVDVTATFDRGVASLREHRAYL